MGIRGSGIDPPVSTLFLEEKGVKELLKGPHGVGGESGGPGTFGLPKCTGTLTGFEGGGVVTDEGSLGVAG
eukprot:767076-Hanusia_phi.AAC.7